MRTVVLFFTALTLAADWPRFRGPNGAGLGEAALASWTETTNRLWKYEVPGSGNGSPIVVKGKVFLQSAAKDGSTRSLHCLNAADGKEIWTKTHKGASAKTHKKNSLASSTPASDDERIYVCFWDGSSVALVAYDFKGQELWSEKLGSFSSDHGAGMSPMVHAGKVFVNFDQEAKAALLAFDAKTGKPAWSMERKGYRACYSTPMVRDLPDGRSEVVVLSTAGLTAYDPESGHVNWDSPFQWGKKSPLRSVASPVAVGDLIVAVTGDGGGDRYCAGIKPGTKPIVVWQSSSSKLAPYVPCPVAKGKHLFWITAQGMLECIDPSTGKPVWRESVFAAGVSASPILLGDVLLIIDERGKAIACKADSSGYEQLSVSQVGEAVFATPAAADGKLFVRGATILLCIGAK